MKKDIKAIDIDLETPVQSGGVAYYRLTKEMKEFLSKCNKKQIIGFEYEEGSFNFGVILAEE